MRYFNIFLLFYLLGCKNNEVKQEVIRSGCDTIARDIPEWLKNTGASAFFEDQMTSLLNLQKLDSGYHEFELRIWLYHEFKDHQQLIIIKMIDSIWSASFYDIFLKFDGAEGEFYLKNEIMVSKQPSSGWNIFLNMLLELGINDLKDETTFTNYYATNALGTVSVEIAKPCLYKYYSYQSFDINKKRFDDPVKLEKALQLIQNEFNWQRLEKTPLEVKIENDMIEK